MPSSAVVQMQSAAGLPDAEIVRRVRSGDAALFEVLMRRHNPLVYRTVRSILRDEAEAEDAMQQAWLRCYFRLGEFEGRAAFSTWLVRIAVNEALGRTRAGSRLTVVDELPEGEETFMTEPVETPEERASVREAVALVERAIDALPAPHRTVIMLRDVQGFSTAEVAESLDITEESVRVRLHRAHATVREALLAQVRASAREAFPFLAPRCDRMVAVVLYGISRTP
ncbi:MAG TPA: RNA polymerase sigma factor [Anaeromyxobacteraceae bacterium]|nr:RNA polymerase sigma factor [Anaeromyxobacteraceae bacterium]